MTYIRAEDAQLDLWEKVGNTGWNWASLFPYYRYSEHFDPPNPKQVADGAAYIPAYHGFAGHVDVGWTSVLMAGGAAAVLNATWQKLGLPYNRDANGGKLRGFTVWPFTAKDDVRADSARAYYWPVAAQRKNLHVMLNTTATRLIWAEGGNETALTAKSVEVTDASGKIWTVSASREIILSAGAFRSPLLLENSGVGNPAYVSFDPS